MKKIKAGLVWAMLFSINAVAQQGPVVYTLDSKTVTAKKRSIAAGDAVLMPAYQQLLSDANKALAQKPMSVMEKKNLPPSGDRHDYMSLAPYFWPDPSKPDGLPYIRKDGQTNPEVKEYKDKEYMPRLCEMVHTLSLAWYYSGEKKYAEHAALLVRTWFLDEATRMNPNLNFGQAIKGRNEGRGAGLIDTRHFIRLIAGLGFLQTSAAWTKADNEGMKKWFSQFLHWMQTSPNGHDEMEAANNHGTWYDAQRLAMALFIDSTESAKKIVANAVQRLDRQMDEEGKFPKEMERTIALHYNVFDLEAFFLIAAMAEKTGMNVWEQTTTSGKSIKKGFDFLYPYLTKKQEWKGQQIKPFEYEEAYPLLLQAARKLNCKDCPAELKTLAGDKAGKLGVHLLY